MRKFTLLFFFSVLLSSLVLGQCSITADYTYKYTGCSTIQFTDASTTPSYYNHVKWQWDYGDGDTATGKTVSHTFQPGITVNVTLRITADSSGVTCSQTKTKQIAVHALPTVYVASDHNPSCIVVAAQFFGSSGMEPYIKSWQWDFGDGTFDTLQNPTHLYPDTGSYRVFLHVIDSNGCANENAAAYIQKVFPLSKMDFTWSVDPAAVVDKLQFTAQVDTTYGKVTSWHWDFGDGDTANIQNPTHQYGSIGQYQVKLSIVINGFCPNSITKTVTVEPLPAPDFKVSPVCLNDTTFFTDLSTTPVGTITTWKWYFGDGDSLIVHKPGNPDVKHIYRVKTTYPVTLLTINSKGYQRSITKNITVVPKPVAKFTFNDTCYTQPTSFIDESSLEGGSPISSWNWNFGDTLSGASDSSRLQNPTHIISVPGTYPVRLIIENTDGCWDTIVRNVVMDSLPAVNFTMSQDSICMNQAASFHGIGTNINSWHWDFGNGDSSRYQDTVYQFSTPGLHTVTLTVKGSKGCTSSVSHDIYVYPIPNPDFRFTIFCKGDTTCFSDRSTISSGYIQHWQWSFGDGSSDTIQNPTHLYQPVGQYLATLYVTSDKSCTTAITQTVIFDSLPSPDFNVSPVCLNDTTFFTDKTTTPVGTIQTLKWYFGDGDSLIVNNLDSFNVKHIYRAKTTYNVTLSAISTFGFERSITKQITVHRKPKAAFTFNDTCYTRPITFTDSSYKAGGTALSSWRWNFGDPLSGAADTSSLQNPTHIMSTIDTFNVRLIVSNIAGCQDTAYKNVVVDSLPAVDFTIQKDSICFGENAHFYGIGKDITSWRWDFGNGDSSAYQNPVYRYPAPGFYKVTLTVTGLKGCPNSISHYIYVIALPKPDFSAESFCIGDSTALLDKTTTAVGYIAHWHWNFGDTASTADTSSRENPKHLFSTVRSYRVRLTTTNNYGCLDSVSHFVNIYDRPKPGFVYHQSCNPVSEVIFTDTSHQGKSKSPIKSYQWNFYQTDSSYLQNPVYRFPDYDTTYQVTLTVTDTNGCSYTDTTQVILKDSVGIDFTLQKDSVCFGDYVYFYGKGSDVVSWHWDFGNGDTSVYQNPVYKYPAPGLYHVTLTETDLTGCVKSISHQVYVIALPRPDFSAKALCIGDSTAFIDKTSSPDSYVTNWHWNFGDTASTADTSSSENPKHLFTKVNTYTVQLVTVNNYGCSDTISHFVNIYARPKPGFIYQQSCDPATEVTFTDTSLRSSSKSPIVSYQWNFYQTDSSYLQNPVYRFPDYDSSYQVTLTVTDTNGCRYTDTTTVLLRDSLRIDFTNPTTCFGKQTLFKTSYQPGSDSIASYTWDFNDGNQPVSSYHDTISHIFPQPGIYNVKLSVTDTNGCSAEVTHQAVIDSLPVPNFTYVTPDCDQPTYFTDSSQGGGNFIKTWQWDFGDVSSGNNNYSSLTNPDHIYISNDSIYQVKLIITNFNGCTDSITKPITRRTCLSVLYTASTSTGCADNTIYFMDKSNLHATTGNITRWKWNFGDGTVKTYQTFADSTPHVYKTDGKFLVTLTITANINGRPFSRQYDSTIIISLPPSANFSASNACTSQTVYFTDATETFGSNLTGWQWDFDDSGSTQNSSSLQNPEHIYETTNNYNVQLVVTDDKNCRDTVVRPLEVHTTPKASFHVNYNYNGVTGQVMMNNTSAGADSYFWDFGDGSTSTEENPVYKYTSIDIFHIMLIATSQYQCSDTATSVYDLTSGLYVPNSFSPSSNVPGTNLFLPKGVHLAEYHIQIYSTWGTLLWESSKLTANGEPVEGWDGTYKGQPMPAGNYIWRIKAKFIDGSVWNGADNGDGNIKPYGTFTLIR